MAPTSRKHTTMLSKRFFEQSLITDMFKPTTSNQNPEDKHPKKAKMELKGKHIGLNKNKKRKLTKKLKLKEGIYPKTYD